MTITPEQALQIAEELYRLGTRALASGRHAEAAARLLDASARLPGRADVWCDLGLAQRLLGRLDEAVAAYRQALHFQPGLDGAWLNLGEALASLGRVDEAIASYRRAIDLRPDDAGAHNNLGNSLAATGRREDAIGCFDRAIALDPGFAEAHYNRGSALSAMRRWDEAITALRRVLTLRPELAEAHDNLGVALKETGCVDEAIACHRRAVELRPNTAEAHNNLGTALAKAQRPEEAIACYQRAIELRLDVAAVHANLGGAWLDLDRLDEARACCERALALDPNHAKAHASLGIALRRAGSIERALHHFRRAAECDPDFADARLNVGLLLLLLGRHDEGWREYECRWQAPSHASVRRNFAVPQWDGSPAAGRTILVHAEQGLGDAIQFLRYVPLVRERSGASRVLFECPPPLVQIFAQSGEWNAEVVARESWDGAALPPFDLHVPMLSLPLALGQFEPLPMAAPYLHADSALRAAWRERLPAGFRVGIAWAGSAAHTNDRRRSIAIEKLSPLLRVPGVHFCSLQIGARADGMIDPTGHITDFADTAALMAELDLIITVDTATAHLAGALGRCVWTLLPFVPDWRWGLEREETPWYPTMRLFRQRTPGDWEKVIARAAAELSSMPR